MDGDGILDIAYSLLPDEYSGPFAYDPGWIGGTGIFLGLDQQEPSDGSIFPNPMTDQLTVRLPSGVPAAQVTLSDLAGRVLREEWHITGDLVNFNVAGLPHGHYFVRVQDTGETFEAVKR